MVVSISGPRLLTALVLSSLCLLSPAAAQASRPTATESVSLRLETVPGQLLRIEMGSTKDNHLIVDHPDGEKSWRSNFTRIVKAIDQYEKVTDNGFVGTRTYHWDRSTKNGEITDRPRNGATFRYQREGGEIRATCESDPLMEDDLRRELMLVESLGAWLDLPPEVRIGQIIEVDLVTLAPLLFDLDQKATRALAWLELKSVDLATGEAALVGRLRLKAPQTWGDTRVVILMECHCVIRVDTNTKLIQQIFCQGGCEYVGECDGRPARGSLMVTSHLEVMTGDEATALSEEPIELRDADRWPHGYAMTFRLPSYWSDRGKGKLAKTAGWRYRTAQGGAGHDRNLFVSAWPTKDPSRDIKDFVRGVADSTGQTPTLETIVTGVGPGSTVEVGGVERFTVTDLIPWRNRLTLIRLEAPEVAREAALADLELVRRSLVMIEDPDGRRTLHGDYANGGPGLPADGHPEKLVGAWEPSTDDDVTVTYAADGSWTSWGTMMLAGEETAITAEGTWHVHRGAIYNVTTKMSDELPGLVLPYLSIEKLVEVGDDEYRYVCPAAGTTNRMVRVQDER